MLIAIGKLNDSDNKYAMRIVSLSFPRWIETYKHGYISTHIIHRNYGITNRY